jgi:hypothetical protein
LAYPTKRTPPHHQPGASENLTTFILGLSNQKKKKVKSTHCLHLWLKVFNGLENFMQACMRLKVNYHRDLKDLIQIGEFGSKHINRKSETLNEFNRSKLYLPLGESPFFSFFVMSIGSHFSSTNLICGVFQFSQHEGFLFC